MGDQDQAGKVLAWLAGALFSAALVLLFIGKAEGSARIEQLGQLSCGLFLLMPAVLIWLRPNLALALVNILFRRAVASPIAPMDAKPLIDKTEWQRLSLEQKVFLIFVAIIGVIAGGYIIYKSF